MLPLSSSLRSKKLFHKRGTFIGHQSFNDNSFRMQSRTGIFLIATFLIFGAKHKSARLCPGDSSGTHHTGFNCDIQSTFIEIFTPKNIGCGSNRLHFGMGRHIIQCFREIVGTRNNPLFTNHNSPHGHFPRSAALRASIKACFMK